MRINSLLLCCVLLTNSVIQVAEARFLRTVGFFGSSSVATVGGLGLVVRFLYEVAVFENSCNLIGENSINDYKKNYLNNWWSVQGKFNQKLSELKKDSYNKKQNDENIPGINDLVPLAARVQLCQYLIQKAKSNNKSSQNKSVISKCKNFFVNVKENNLEQVLNSLVGEVQEFVGENGQEKELNAWINSYAIRDQHLVEQFTNLLLFSSHKIFLVGLCGTFFFGMTLSFKNFI